MDLYEQKYNDALDLARTFYEGYIIQGHNGEAGILAEIFPELIEDEDERTRKEILELIKQSSEILSKQNQNNMIAWLEKQGESTITNIEIPFWANDSELQEVSYNIPEGFYAEIKDGRVVIKKVGPKLKNGQWIVWQDKCYKVNYNGCGYELIDQNGLSTSLEYGTIDKNAHLWDITKDAKDGDVLVDSYSKDSIIILYKGIYKERTILAHCGWNGYNLTVNTNGFGYGGLDNTNYLPATKEQRNLLFQKMKDSGYEWNADKKELKKIEVASKEGKDEREELILYLKGIRFTTVEGAEQVRNWIAWLDRQSKKLDANKVIEWLNNQACLGWIEDVEVDKFVEKFKRDFGI